MPALDQTLALWAGDTRRVTIPVRDADKSAPNLSDATAAWWMGDAPTSAAEPKRVLIRKATGAELTIVQVDGVWSLRFTIETEDTLNLPPGAYYHEAEVTDADGNRSTVTVGRFVIQPTIIRPAG
ncbi:hypothetical protein [Methylobacterium sp. A54F]